MQHPSRHGAMRRRRAAVAGVAAMLAVMLQHPGDARTADSAARPPQPQLPVVSTTAPPAAGFFAIGAADAMSVTKLIGTEVVGSTGRSLGTVANVVFQADGHVESLVVKTGGFLGIGQKHAVVPWTSERMRMQGPYLVTSLSRMHLRAAPDAEKP